MTGATVFHYKAIDAQSRIVTGSWDGPDADERAVVAYLQGRGLVPLRIQLAPFADAPAAPRPTAARRSWRQVGRGARAETRELVSLAEDVALLLGSGVPLSRALVILTELHASRKTFAGVLRKVNDDMREGSTFWEALERRDGFFPPIFVNMVRAGESSGALPIILERLSGYLEEIQELKDYLRSAMIYPVILTVTSLVSMVLMLTLVVPKFAEVFQDMGMALPAMTQAMFTLGLLLRDGWWALVLGTAGIIAAVLAVLRVERWRRGLDGAVLRIPAMGMFVRKIEVARFCRTLGTLLDSGVPILQAMNIVQGVVFNGVIHAAVAQAGDDLKRGVVLSGALRKTGLFPELALNMIGVGEETGRLGHMLDKVGQLYDKELKKGIKTFSSFFEPMVLLVMGVLIGGMVISMLMAIFSINDVQM